MKIKLSTNKAIKEVIYFLFFPALILLNVALKIFMKIKRYKNINIVYLKYNRIGHLAADNELFLRSNLRRIKIITKIAIIKVTYFLLFPVLILINIIIKIFMKLKGYKNM